MAGGRVLPHGTERRPVQLVWGQFWQERKLKLDSKVDYAKVSRPCQVTVFFFSPLRKIRNHGRISNKGVTCSHFHLMCSFFNQLLLLELYWQQQINILKKIRWLQMVWRRRETLLWQWPWWEIMGAWTNVAMLEMEKRRLIRKMLKR